MFIERSSLAARRLTSSPTSTLHMWLLEAEGTVPVGAKTRRPLSLKSNSESDSDIDVESRWGM